MFVGIIITTHSDRALFNLNALVSSLGTIVYQIVTMVSRASTRPFKLNSPLSLCVIIILYCEFIDGICEKIMNEIEK